MYKDKRILTVIPARGRNDGLEHMNMRELGGKPLVDYTFQAAQKNAYIDELMVSTEDQGIADYARQKGVSVPYLRDPSLSETTVDMVDILQGQEFDWVMSLYPNAPFKTSELLTRFMERFYADDMDRLFPVYGHQNFFFQDQEGHLQLLLDNQRHSRRDALKKYEESGGVYIFKPSCLSEKRSDQLKTGFVELDFLHSRMVNTIFDLYLLDRAIKLPKTLLQDMLKFK